MDITQIRMNLRWYQLMTREIHELKKVNKIRPVSNAIIGLKAEANSIFKKLENEIPADLLTQLPITSYE